MANIVGTAGDDELKGTANADIIRGLIGSDLLLGKAGDDELFGNRTSDILDGGRGSDFLDGGNGLHDTATYLSSPSGINLNLSFGIAFDDVGAIDTLVRIEDIIGSSFDDVLIGDNKSNALFGADGADILDGLGGNDLIDEEGDQNSAGYLFSPSGVTVDLLNGVAQDGFGGTDELVDIIDIIGSSFNDRLKGDQQDNGIEGLEGNDLINGRDGLDGALYFSSPNGVVIDLRLGTAEDGYGTTDTLVNIEGSVGSDFADRVYGDSGDNLFFGGRGGDHLRGDSGADALFGDPGQDHLAGGRGADFLDGGRGNDVMSGGGGGDTFAFTGSSPGADTIEDFGERDVIDVSELLDGFVEGQSDLNAFIRVVDDGSDAVLGVDSNGGGNSFVDVAVISGGAGTTLDSLVSGGNLARIIHEGGRATVFRRG